MHSRRERLEMRNVGGRTFTAPTCLAIDNLACETRSNAHLIQRQLRPSSEVPHQLLLDEVSLRLINRRSGQVPERPVLQVHDVNLRFLKRPELCCPAPAPVPLPRKTASPISKRSKARPRSLPRLPGFGRPSWMTCEAV